MSSTSWLYTFKNGSEFTNLLLKSNKHLTCKILKESTKKKYLTYNIVTRLGRVAVGSQGGSPPAAGRASRSSI